MPWPGGGPAVCNVLELPPAAAVRHGHIRLSAQPSGQPRHAGAARVPVLGHCATAAHRCARSPLLATAPYFWEWSIDRERFHRHGVWHFAASMCCVCRLNLLLWQPVSSYAFAPESGSNWCSSSAAGFALLRRAERAAHVDSHSAHVDRQAQTLSPEPRRSTALQGVPAWRCGAPRWRCCRPRRFMAARAPRGTGLLALAARRLPPRQVCRRMLMLFGFMVTD